MANSHLTSRLFPFYNFTNFTATDLILDGWQRSQNYTNVAFNSAIQFLDNVATVSASIGNIPTINQTLGAVTSKVGAFQKPTPPQSPNITPNFPTISNNVNLTPVSNLVVPPEPVYNISNFVEKTFTSPTPFTKTAPTAPTIPTRQLPNKPSYTIPTAPTLRQLTLPTAPSIIDPVFNGILPKQLKSAPDVSFNFIDKNYSSTLLTTLINKLEALVNGMQTGLPPQVEQQIWDRARRRTSITARRLKAQNERYWSASGWDIPGGDLTRKNYEAEQDTVNLDVSESREIAIAQANLEQNNFQFAMNTAVQIEGITIQHFDAAQNRALDAAKYAVQAAIELYGLVVSEFNANVQAYVAHAEVFQKEIEILLARISLFKEQLEAQKIIGELNNQDIENYREQINALLAIFELYKSELEAVRIQLAGDELTIKQFESLIRGFESEIRAKTLEYEGLKLENESEKIRADVFATRHNAYESQVNAFTSLIEGRKTAKDSEIEVNQRVPLEVFKQKSETLRTLVQAESERLKALNDTYKTDSDVYESATRAESARVDGEVRVQEQEIRYLIAESQVQIESLKANIASMLSQTELMLKAAEEGARVSSQLVAAALSTVNLSASASESDSESYSESKSSSTSVSTTTVLSGSI